MEATKKKVRSIKSKKAGNIESPAVKKNLKSEIFKARYLYLMLLPILIHMIVFKYGPMYGIIIAFKDYKMGRGIIESSWVGLKHFKRLFANPDFYLILRNSIMLNVYDLLVNFPIPIILALLLNEVRNLRFKKTIQNVLYMPHFISWVVLSGIIINVLSPSTGIVNNLITIFGGKPIFFMADNFWWRVVYTLSSTWKESGWATIIYLAAITGVNTELYEAAKIDGAGRFRQAWSVTLPGIRATIAIQIVLRMGSMLGVGFEKVWLLRNDYVRQISEVFATYTYRIGILDMNFSYSTAVGLFQAVVNVILLLTANRIVKALGEEAAV